jgi:hypothetical protein
MRIIITILVIATSTIFCGKKNSTCWTCSFTSSSIPDREVCNDGEDPDLGVVKDEQGNEVGWYCEKK